MTAAELLTDGDFANAEAASRVTVVARPEGHPSRQWFLSPGPDSGQPPVALPQPGYMRLAASRGARLRQALATPEHDVVLRAAVRVVSGELLIGAAEGNRPGPTTRVRADSGWQDVDLAVPGLVDQVVLYAAADSTVIDVKQVSLTHNGQPAPEAASPAPAGRSDSPPGRLDTLLAIAVPDADARRRVQPELDRPAASLTAIAAAFARQGAADNAAAVGYLHDVVAVAGSDVRLAAALQQRRPAGARSAALELTAYTAADWQTVLAGTHPEMTPAQRTIRAQALGDAAQAAFPSAALIAAARADTQSSLHKPELLEFFDTHPGIDLLTSALRSVPALQVSPRVRADLERIQRLARVSAKPAHVDVLNKAGYGSAGAVARKGRAAFVSAHAAALGGEPAATEVFERAALISSRAMAVYAQHSPTFNRAMPRVLTAAGDAETAIPDWRALFGDALDLVTDDPARSVYSPAAYLADLLRFLDQQPAAAAADGTAQTGLDVLALKRPDLLRLALDQANTDVELPMIDLVNELLECAVLAENAIVRQPQWCTSAPPAGSVDTGVGAWITATVTDTDPAPWGAAGAAYHQTPAATGYHAHGFTVPAGQTGLQLAPADMIGVWVRPHPDTPPGQIVLTVTPFPGTPHVLIWGYPPNDSQWTPGGATHLQAGPLPPLGQWSLVILDAGVGAAVLTGLEFGCVDGAVDWGPAGSYPAAPPTTTSGTSDDRRRQPQAVRDQAYDAIAPYTFPWSSTPLDLGFRTGAAALTALGVSFAEMLGAFTAPDRAAELTDARIAVTKLGIGPELHSLLSGTDGGTEAGHWGLTDDGAGSWFQQLLHAEEFLSRAGLTAAQMRTPPGAVCSRGLALLPATDPGTGDLELVIGGLTESSLPRLRRFLRLWRAVGGDHGPLERFYHSFADLDPIDQNPDINDDLLARLALAQDTATRLGTDLLTITTWWTALLDAGGYADPAVYPDDGPGSIANSPYSRIFLNPALGDAAATFGLGDGGEIARTVTITAALPAIAAALGGTAEDLTLLLASPLSGIDPPPTSGATLTRSVLSAIYRAVTFARAADLTMADFLSLRALTAIDPFDAAAPANLTLFLDASDAITSAGVSIAEIDYLLAGTIRPGTDFAASPAANAVADIVGGLTQLSQVHQVVPDPNGDVVRRELIAAGSTQSPDTVLAALDGTGTYYAPLAADPGLSEADQALLRWDHSVQELQGGALTTSEQDTLLGRYNDPPARAAIQMIYQAPRAVLAAVPGLDAATAGQLLDGDLPPDQRHLQVLTMLVPAVLTLLATTQITQKLASRLHLDRDLTGDLLEAATDAAGTTAMSLLLSLNATSSPGDLGEAADAVLLLDKLARVCALAGLTTAQIRHAITYGPAAGWLDLLSLPTAPQDAPDFAGWQHLMAYAGLRDRLADRNDILLSIFSAAAGTASGTADTDAALSRALAQLSALTGWPLATLTELHQLLGLAYPDSYRDEKALLRLERAMAVVSIAGADQGRVHGWTADIGATQTGSDILAFAHARTNGNPGLLQPVEDSLRHLRRDALANYLHPPARGGALDDTLLGRFLIDTGVDVGRTTTRIAAATQAIQLFVQRALLDLDTQLSLTSDAKDEWAWLDSYTTWSANRQVFIYAENWLDPELRQGLTPQFSTLQAELQHGDLTNDSAETALIDYLQNLDTIGQLQGAALYQEDETDSTGTITISTLHAIARTRSTPHRYYYRQRPGSGLWTAWEDIGVDIDGENLAAYILNRQLHLFWLQMVDQVDQPTAVPAAPVPVTNLDARLAWTKRGLNGWSPKQLSSDTIKITPPLTGNNPSALFLDVRWSAPGTTVTELTLAVRQYSPPDPSVEPYSAAEEVATFEYSGDTNDVSTGADAGSISVIAPIASWDFSDLTTAVPGRVNYQAWTVGPKFVIPSFNPHGPLYTTIVFQGISTSRVLGATSAAPPLDPNLAYAIDPNLPFFVEPPGLSLLAHPIISPDSGLSYQFEIGYHPYAKPFLREIVRAGVPALFARSVQLEPENLPADRSALNWAGMGPISTTNEDLQETVDFDSGGYFSTYNWELFFHAPLLIAKRLSVAQRFGEAKTWLEYVFNPADRSSDPVPAKYWQTKPLYKAASDQSVEDLLKSLDGQPDSAAETQVRLWRQRPFDADVIAVLRPSAYQKATVMAYLDNLIAWGDWHFARQGPEDLASATQLYLFAADLLGPPPEPGPVPGPTLADPPVYCFADLRHSLDSFSDAVVELENRLAVWTAPVDGPPGFKPAPGAVLLPSLYFNVPPNERLLSYWDTVTDRLSKVRAGENLAGQAITTPAYPSVGNPGELIQAASMGATTAASARPVYRFPTLIAKARELCADVRSLGGQLLTALEKQDAEMLAAMRSGQDLRVLRTGRAVRVSALTEATQQIAQLQAAYGVAAARQAYYAGRERYNAQELEQVTHLQTSAVLQAVSQGLEALGTAFGFVPEATAGVSGAMSSPVITASVGGRELASAASLVARIAGMAAGIESHLANMAGLSGGWQRRWDDWQFQAGQASLEMAQISAQILAAQTRQQQAQQELDEYDERIADAQQVDDFFRTKYTNAELYGWMVSQMASLYSQSYQLALDAARRAEAAFRYELAPDPSTFIQPGYWNSLRSGLLAGEQLAHDLQQMEAAFLDRNTRQFEITKNVSLALAAPDALIQLRTTGQCTLKIPEEWFDLDYPGHYLRRTRRVAISIPCVTGPYTGVHATLSLLSDSTRIDPVLNSGRYERSGLADARFADRYGLSESIVTSGGLNQSGAFGSGGDDRFEQFEGVGAISTWLIELPPDTNAFSLNTVTDVILHLSYTARDGGPGLRAAARAEVVVPLRQFGTVLLTGTRDFPQQWQQLLAPGGDPRALTLPLGPDLLPGTAAPSSGISRLRLYLETSTTSPITVQVTPPGATAISMDLGQNEALPGLLAGAAGFSFANLGDWTIQWPGDALSAAAPADLLVLADYEPPARRAAMTSDKGPALPSPWH